MIVTIDLTKVVKGNPCFRDSSHTLRYLSGACVICCRLRKRGIFVRRSCPCGVTIDSTSHGNTRWCNDCQAEYERTRRARPDSHEEKRKPYQRQYDRTRQSGMTPEMFEECLRIQNDMCGLCGVDLNTLDSTHVHADHVPESDPKKPRGVLCRRCNTRWLGQLEKAERAGDCKITNPQLLEWQQFPPMSRSSFAEQLGWARPLLEDHV